MPKQAAPVYRDLMWTCIPYLTQGYTLNKDASSNPAYIPPADVTIRLRVQKPYNRLATISTVAGSDTMPRYQFSTVGFGATQNNATVAKSALDEIKIVPNPYLAYSVYETSQNSRHVKVTNLPNTCTISIYSLDGQLIKVINRAIGLNQATNLPIETTSGTDVNSVNVENSVSWDLTNTAGVPIASGIYLFHISAPGIGDKTLKWFGAVRPADTSNF